MKIRELNDEINQLLKTKGLWEDQIKKLGGPDYKNENLEEGGLLAENGYLYFGAAKNLPGVKEVFKKDIPMKP